MIKIQNIIVDRQCRNKDWNQDLLDDAKVTLVGAGPLANFVATNLVCLNVGNIRIIDNSLYDGNKNEFILARDSKKGKKAKLLEKTLKSMNPYLKIDGIDSKVIDGFALNSDIVVDLTNNIYSKFNSIDFAKKNKVPLILSSTDFTKSIISLYNIEDKEKSLDDLFFKMENKKQGNLTSAFASGFIVEEIRKILHGKESKKDKDNTLKKNIYYYLNKENRFQNGDLIDILNHNFTDKKILMAGAGALGNFFIINSALLGFGNIDVIDMDTIEETNLNRQPLYSFNFPEYVGNKKVNVISNELKKINNKINVRGVYGKLFEQLTKDEIESQVALINEDILDKTNYDLIVGCLDNINTRAKINMYAVKRKIPYIDGGTGPFGGRVAIYVPDKTACLDCQLGLYQRMSKKIERNSCISDDHEPSVVMPNNTIAALMAGEASLLLSDNYQNPPKNTIYLDSYSADRVNINRIKVMPSEKCKCYGEKNE